MLERRGAVVQHGPALRIVPLADDTDLLAATRDARRAAAGHHGGHHRHRVPRLGRGRRRLGARRGRCCDALGAGTLIARGPKARGAIRASGLTDAWSPASESSAEVLEHLLAEGVEGRRIAVQLHGEPLPDVVEALTMAGAEVVEVPVYRWDAARRHRARSTA